MIGEGGEPEAVMPLSKLAALLDEWTKPKPQGGGSPEDGDGDRIVWSLCSISTATPPRRRPWKPPA